MEYNKPPVSISDQISKLKRRGLHIADEALAKRYLSNISYYRLRAYTYPYQDNADANHLFLEKVSFEDILDLYSFFRKIRLLFFVAVFYILLSYSCKYIYISITTL